MFLLPAIAQKGLSTAEMNSAVNSYYLGSDAVLNGDLVDLPYRLLQKLSIMIFGLTAYTIKLPSIIVGLIFGLLLILLLNRWFKSNVSLLASTLIVLSTPFLFLAGSGTPLIMVAFWPTLLLWLGSKIQGEKRPKPGYCFAFALALLLSIFTPYMLYFAIFCVIFVLVQPHLRFVVKSLPKLPFAVISLIVVAGLTSLIINIINHPDTIMQLLFAKNFEIGHFFQNILAGLSPLFSWKTSLEGVFLSPLISLPTFALALIGLFSTTKGFFASRNSIASLLIVFGLIITGFKSEMIIFLILPLSILVAHGLKYMLEKWYGLFPTNPYARISALLPLTILFSIMIIPSLLQYIYGYRYNPNVADDFSDTLTVIRENLTNQNLFVEEKDYRFYKILEASSEIKVFDSNTEWTGEVAILKNIEEKHEKYQLSRIITSPKVDNSDIIYLYVEKGE
ncbi:glycosyltransferase family 39 protein [Candidatus Saccharibacteria bacterium]|nr:glycosyltransferase family 39 protein [Candidatus Saccharibacteria bacterium]